MWARYEFFLGFKSQEANYHLVKEHMVKSLSCFVIGFAKYSMIRLSPWLQEQIMWRQTKRYDAQHKQYDRNKQFVLIFLNLYQSELEVLEAENRKLRVELDQMKMHHDSEIEAMKKQNNSLLEDGERYKEVCLLNYKHDLFLYTTNILIKSNPLT